MSCQKATKEVVSSRIVQLLAARPRLLLFLLVVTVSVVSGSLAVGGEELLLEPGVMEDGESNPGPGP